MARFATCRIVSRRRPRRRCAIPTAPGCISAARPRRRPLGRRVRRRRPDHRSPASTGSSTVNDRRQHDRRLFAEQPQLRVLHAQHLPHHRPARSDPRPSLHQRAQGLRRDLRQRQHGLPGAAGGAARPFLRQRPAPLPARCARAAGSSPDLPGQFDAPSSTASRSHDQRSEDEWTGTGVLSFQPNNDLLLYASYSRGYKAGGFNLDRSALKSPILARSTAPAAAPRRWSATSSSIRRSINAYELGVKYPRGPFTLNVAAVPPGFQQLPAQHVQRHRLPRPEHQRLRRPDRRQRHRSATSSATPPAPAPADDVDATACARTASRSRRRSGRAAT